MALLGGNSYYVLLHLLCFYSPSQTYEYPADYSPQLCQNTDTPFHFIVAGAGSAGAALAVRLSEERSWNVLLLERGSDQINNNTEIPILWSTNLKSELDYDYKGEPHGKFYQGLEGQASSISAGKASGGGSTINAQTFLRGSRRDLDEWRNLGCAGWDYKSVKKYFLKMEDYQSTNYDPFYHHRGGPITCSELHSKDPAISTFEKALALTKLPHVRDFNSELEVGYGYGDGSIRDGRRWSTFKGYVSTAASRKNFFFARNVMVRKVVIDERTKTAKGVEISLPDGKKCVVRALKEVVLSLGTIVSPQILMLSGIGPKEHLKSMNISLMADLPVGSNYHDHPGFVGLIATDNIHRSDEEIRKQSDEIMQDTMYYVNKNMPTLGLRKLKAFINTRRNGDPHPDLQLIFSRVPYKSFLSTRNKRNVLYNCLGFSNETSDLFTEWNNKADTILIMLIVSKGNSRGHVQLKSANPEDHPKITPNILGSPKDADKLLRGIRYVQRVFRTKPIIEARLELQFIDYPACRQYRKDSDEYWRCAFNQIVTGFYHPVGSVKMGAKWDSAAVLDPRLRVKHIRNLRVCDASVMPRIVSVNINPTVIMIAEKAADMIKQDHRKMYL